LAPTPTPPSPQADPFRYGWRYQRRTRPDGSEELCEVPLTLEDVLHPQEDDVIPQRPYHERDRRYLSNTLRTRLPRLRGGLVLADCLVDWGVPGQRNTSPDISVFADLDQQPPSSIGTFRLAPSGGHCLLVIELVSPDTRTNDVDRKPDEYHQAGVPLYVIVDQKGEEGPRQLLAYRHTPEGYVLEELDEYGRVLLEPLGLRLGLKDNRVVCFDAQTGDELGDYTQEHEARQAAEQDRQREAQARQAAEQRLREVEAELRRLRGEAPE
jgi:Uma2 family endonuclease